MHQHTLCHVICVVVVWCDVLGALHWRQYSLSWCGPSHPPQTSEEWAQIGQTG